MLTVLAGVGVMYGGGGIGGVVGVDADVGVVSDDDDDEGCDEGCECWGSVSAYAYNS